MAPMWDLLSRTSSPSHSASGATDTSSPNNATSGKTGSSPKFFNFGNNSATSQQQQQQQKQLPHRAHLLPPPIRPPHPADFVAPLKVRKAASTQHFASGSGNNSPAGYGGWQDQIGGVDGGDDFGNKLNIHDAYAGQSRDRPTSFQVYAIRDDGRGQHDDGAAAGGGGSALRGFENSDRSPHAHLRPLPLQPSPTRREPPPRNPNRAGYRSSAYRPASSVYSQHSPVSGQFGPGTTQGKLAPPPLPTLQTWPPPSIGGLTSNKAADSDISPPSSPEIRTPRDGPEDVSPIDQVPNMSQLEPAALPRKDGGRASNIPMMRRERRQHKEAETGRAKESAGRPQISAPLPLHQRPADPKLQGPVVPGLSTTTTTGPPRRGDVRWDALTGERTSSNLGIPSQVKPVEYARGFGAGSSPARSGDEPIEGDRSAYMSHPAVSFGERVRRMRNASGSSSGSGGNADGATSAAGAAEASMTSEPAPPPTTTNTNTTATTAAIPRPEWRGASGRTTLVAPVRDERNVAPLNIPRRSSKRATRLGGHISSPLSPVDSEGLASPVEATTPKSGGGVASSSAAAAAAASLFSSAVETIRRVVPSSQLMQGGGVTPTTINSRDGGGMGGGMRGTSDTGTMQTRSNGADAQAYPSPPLSGHGAAKATGANYTSDAINAATIPASGNPLLPHISANNSSAVAAGNNINSIGAAASPVPAAAPPAVARKPASQNTVGSNISQVSTTKPTAPPPAHHNHAVSTSSSVYSHHPGPLHGSIPFPPLPPGGASLPVNSNSGSSNDPWVQPASRFSVTTYATSGHTSSPRHSLDFADADAPPLPTPPQQFVAQLSAAPTPAAAPTSRFDSSHYENNNNNNNNTATTATTTVTKHQGPTETSMLDRKRPPVLGRTMADDSPGMRELPTTSALFAGGEPIRISLMSSPYSQDKGGNNNGPAAQNRGRSPFNSGTNATPNPLRSNPSMISRHNPYLNSGGAKDNNARGNGNGNGNSNNSNNNNNNTSSSSFMAAMSGGATGAAPRASVWSAMTAGTAYTNISVHTTATVQGDTNKSLPPAPPEMTALAAASASAASDPSKQENVADRVAVLKARLDALANRRLNLSRGIKQMTELMPTDLLVASEAVVKKREMEKRKVEALRQELADVQREEYELGLKLHRAYKRLDRESEFERTGLWVRRVTG